MRLCRVELVDACIPELLSPGLLDPAPSSFDSVCITHKEGWAHNQGPDSLDLISGIVSDVDAMVGPASAWAGRIRLRIEVETEAERDGVPAGILQGVGDIEHSQLSACLSVVARVGRPRS